MSAYLMILCLTAFGMTELGVVAMVYSEDCKNLSNVTTIGKLFVGVEAKVIDENGIHLGPNKPGQLCFKCDGVCNLFKILACKFSFFYNLSRKLLDI